MIGPRPIETVGNCQKSGISQGCGYEEHAFARDLLAKALELLLGQPALEEGARVDARRRVALDVDEVAAVLGGRRSPEVVEADLVKERGGLERRDVAAELGRLLVRAQDHRDRVPADERADATLHRGVTRERRLFVGVDRVDVGGRPDVLDGGALAARALDYSLDQIMGTLGAVLLHDGVEGLEPLLSLDCVDISHCLADYPRRRTWQPRLDPARLRAD